MVYFSLNYECYVTLAAEGAGFEASSEKEYLVIDGQRSKHETYYEEKMKK